jgi:NAD(P)-dependent dehydrogenase (short-subunit alcohol dehydrogenase family)
MHPQPNQPLRRPKVSSAAHSQIVGGASRNRFLDGKVVVITSADRGIGTAVGEACAEVGATVVLAGDADSGLGPVAARLSQQRGFKVSFAEVDLNAEDSVYNAFSGVYERYGSLDVAVVNSGAATTKPMMETSLDEWYVLTQLNLTANFLALREAMRPMSYQNRGHIIVVQGSAGRRPLPPPSAAYNSVSRGLSALVDSVRDEARGIGVHVTQVFVPASEAFAWDNDDPSISATALFDPTELARTVVMTMRPRKVGTPEELVLAPPTG